MIVLLILLGFAAVAAGMFGLGLGIPVRDTNFGSAVLTSSSVAITGGLILLGLAIAVSELRRALQTAMRQRLPERFGAEHSHRAHRPEPRIGASAAAGGALGADAADVIPARFDSPDTFNASSAAERPRQPADEKLSAGDKSRQPVFPTASAGPQESGGRDRYAPSWERFDAIRPADFRRPDTSGEDGPQRSEAAGADTDNIGSPPLSPADSTGAIRPVRVLKSGLINDVAYTLFSDGSIETQTSDGLMRFNSIDEFRRHLEKSAG